MTIWGDSLDSLCNCQKPPSRTLPLPSSTHHFGRRQQSTPSRQWITTEQSVWTISENRDGHTDTRVGGDIVITMYPGGRGTGGYTVNPRPSYSLTQSPSIKQHPYLMANPTTELSLSLVKQPSIRHLSFNNPSPRWKGTWFWLLYYDMWL